MTVSNQAGPVEGPARLQVFEVAVAAVFAQLRPDYEWHVSPNLPDGGSDFVGRQQFLQDDTLKIAAAITVGGQCKKRTTVGNVVNEVAGSLVNMVTTINPTFFVVALSARLTNERVTEACQRVERAYQRHCHILDRPQIEGLLNKHRSVLDEILREALSAEEVADVYAHLDVSKEAELHRSVAASLPKRVLAGVPFNVAVKLRSLALSAPGVRMRWRPGGRSGRTSQVSQVNLIGPADVEVQGIELLPASGTDDPVFTHCSLEFLTHSVGEQELGEVAIEGRDGELIHPWMPLGGVRVIENLRPRFYERPFRGALARLGQAFDQARAGGTASIGVVGTGGSGKSRLSEEFGLRQRRRKGDVVVAKQAKTLDDPHRILADLFLGLLVDPLSFEEPSDQVIRAVERYDPDLAKRSEAGIKSIFGLEKGEPDADAEQHLLSALLLLAAVRGRRAPLIIHLQELHWCSADVLLLLEKLVWQLDRILSGSGGTKREPDSGILFIFEGRVRERQRIGREDGWDSEPFEALLQKLDCPVVECSFNPDEGLEFIRRQFEDRHSAERRINLDLLEMQRDLVGRIHKAAGGNPFHSLEQLHFLKERRIIGQNPVTGFLYLIQPTASDTQLPGSVFDAIRLRWTYMKSHTPELALLVWASGLLEDRVPTPLFRRLWADLAPEISLTDINRTEILWTGQVEEDEVAFRHENYFESVRRFEVAREDREKVVRIYCDWFAEPGQSIRPVDRYRWALALLQLPVPDEPQAQSLMGSALDEARRQGDARLARRVAVTTLDLAWKSDARSPSGDDTFLQLAEEELSLATELIDSGERTSVLRRLTRVTERLDTRLASEVSSPRVVAELRRLRIGADVRRSQILFNDRMPVEAAELAEEAARSIQGLRSGGGFDGPAWSELEMEALHSWAVGLAIAGEIDRSLTISAQAVGIARSSQSLLARHVISTYANILMSRAPGDSEQILRQCLGELGDAPGAGDIRASIRINLAMTLVLRADRLGPELGDVALRSDLLEEAGGILRTVFSYAFKLGRYPDAGAAALMLGIISVMRGEQDAVSWFAQAVAAAARGRQMETLWRAHVNLATAMHRSDDAAAGDVRDHAAAALQILEESLSIYPEPDRSPRFESVRVFLAQAVRFLHEAGDEEGRAVLERYPALRSSFADSDFTPKGKTHSNDWRHEWWVYLDGEPYSLY